MTIKKNLIYVCILFITLINLVSCSCKKDAPINSYCGERFYYYQNEKIYLNITNEKVTIGFNDTLSYQKMKNILNQYNFIEDLKQEQVFNNNKLAMPDLIEGLNCKELENKLNGLKKNPEISYANLFLETKNKSALVGITNEFIVNLLDTNQFSELQSLAINTNTEILKQNEFQPDVYILSANKNSDGDALEMANFFHETGKFKFSEPNFIQIIKRLK